jgi:hypothetical protein
VFTQVNEWTLLFSTKQHGHSLQALLRQAAGHALTVLAVTDTLGHVFGCYATSAWEVAGSRTAAFFFGGSGECFLWKWEPEDDLAPQGQGVLVKSDWTRNTSLFQCCGKFKLQP